MSVRSIALPAITIGAVLAVALAIVVAQPVRSPWWTYADADATYTAAALNLVAGHRAQFVDHPGLPVTQLAAAVLAVRAFADGSLTTSERRAFADEKLLDLDTARGSFRGLALFLYLGSALVSVVLGTWFFRDWLAGLAAGLFWIGAPGLMPMAIQLRPDVLLGVCCVAFAYLLAAATSRGSPALYALAAAIAGLALTVKLHAAALVVPLALAVAWRPPADALRPPRRAYWLLGLFALIALLANVERFPYTPTAAQAVVGIAALVALAAATVVAFSVRGRAGAIAGVAAAYVTGILVPIALSVPDGLQALVLLAKAALGRGVSAVPSYTTPLDTGLSLGGTAPLVVFVLALVAAALGVVRRDPAPVLWGAGAIALLVLAWARPVAVHYLAPGYLLAAPCMIWLAQALSRRLVVLAVPLAILAAWPAVRDREAPRIEAARLRADGEARRAAAVARLDRGEVAIAPSYFPDPDVRYFELVELYVEHTPEYPYRVLPATEAAANFAREHGLRPTSSIAGAELP